MDAATPNSHVYVRTSGCFTSWEKERSRPLYCIGSYRLLNSTELLTPHKMKFLSISVGVCIFFFLVNAPLTLLTADCAHRNVCHCVLHVWIINNRSLFPCVLLFGWKKEIKGKFIIQLILAEIHGHWLRPSCSGHQTHFANLDQVLVLF